MKSKTYIEFGTFKRGQKKIYEKLKGDVYDSFMLSRYFNDIFILNKSKKIDHVSKKLHDKKDLRFNLINYLFLKQSSSKNFYEFGQTLFEKIYYIKYFQKIFNENKIKNIKWYGNDISKLFNFFCDNFHQKEKVRVFDLPKFYYIKNSIFFSKGVTLLYYKNNLNLIKRSIELSKGGSFDFSISKKKKFKKLNTGYNLYYPSIKEFENVLQNSKKSFFLRNIKKKKGKIYFEILYAEKKLIKNFFINFNKLKIKFKKNKSIINILGLNKKFYQYQKGMFN